MCNKSRLLHVNEIFSIKYRDIKWSINDTVVTSYSTKHKAAQVIPVAASDNIGWWSKGCKRLFFNMTSQGRFST